MPEDPDNISSHPIGIFDSGVGGLTVYRALRKILPHEDFIYLGDTARLPYGTKSQATVTRYAHQIALRLLQENIKLLVVACNTATALALPSLQALLPDLPCLGVVEPGALAAAQASKTGQIVVLATEGAVRSCAYDDAIHRYRPEANVRGVACNLLVGLAEEGWCEGAEVEAVLVRYFRPLEGLSFDTMVLGCTHFPLLAPAIRRLIPADVALVDSAATTALAVRDFLEAKGLANSGADLGRDLFLVTDAPERFQRLAVRFLPETDVLGVETVNLGGPAG